MKSNGALVLEGGAAPATRRHEEGMPEKMKMPGLFRKDNSLALSALGIGLAALAAVLALCAWVFLQAGGGGKKFAFVDTGRAMTAFKEANAINKEIEAQSAKWKEDLKKMEAGLKAYMDTMSAKFDAADTKKKLQMQDELALRNQQINNFEKVNIKKTQDLSREKMAGVFQKFNALMKEYGKAQGYDVIFGTAQGSILYGDGTPADITDKVIEALNKRYE